MPSGGSSVALGTVDCAGVWLTAESKEDGLMNRTLAKKSVVRGVHIITKYTCGRDCNGT